MWKIKESVCAICGEETGFFSSHRLSDGSHICGACQKLIPASFLDGQYASVEDARAGAEYGRWALAKLSPAFAATVRYGRMALDERNGLFTVCDATAIRKDGKLRAPSPAVYPCIAIMRAEFSISPMAPSAQASRKRGTITCQVQFSGNLERYGIHIRETIRKSASCVLIPDRDGGAAWQEPDDLAAFRGCYRQAVEKAWRKMQETERAMQMEERMKQEQEQKAMERAERQRQQEEARVAMEGSCFRDAKILFMLEEDYTIADLRRQRAVLMRAFHPDNGKTADPAYAQRINRAYECLLENLERRGDR